MSNSTDTTGCISHKRNKRFFVMYEDYLEIASVSKHQYKLAAFWRVLETKTNDRITYNQGLIEEAKKKGEPEPEITLWIEVPYSEYVNRALGIYKSSSFQVAAAESERLGFSASRVLQRKINPQDPQSPKEDYKEYLYLTDRMQSVLDGGEYPTPIEINSPLLKGIEERQKRKAIDKNTTPIEINSPNDQTAIEINGTPLLKSISNKYISNNSLKNIGNIESLLFDDNLLTREEKIAEIEALLQELRSQSTPHQGSDQNATSFSTDPAKGGASPTTVGQNDTPLSPAGNHHADADTPTDHNAIPEPPNRPKTGIVESQPVKIPTPSVEAQKTAVQTQEMPSSTQAVNGTSNQATEQGKQASGDDLIATGATKKPRGGRGKKAEQEPAKLVVVEPDLSHLTEQEQQIYAGLRDEDKPKFLDFTPVLREVYINWLGSYGFAVPVDITTKFVECLKRLAPLHPSSEILKKKREGIKKLDNQRLPEKRFFKNRNPLIWDVVRDWATVDVNENVAQPGTPTSEAPKTYMTRDEAAQLAHDAIAEAKQYTIAVTAQIASLENNPDAWIVRVRWDDGSKDGLSFAIRTRGQWGKKLKEIQKMIEDDAKYAAKLAARMQEAK